MVEFVEDIPRGELKRLFLEEQNLEGLWTVDTVNDRYTGYLQPDNDVTEVILRVRNEEGLAWDVTPEMLKPGNDKLKSFFEELKGELDD